MSYEFSKQRRSKHKMFIGMAPGVGKTYRMLEEAHELKEEGIDVVIGLLETHGREETAEQALGLEVVPKEAIIHNGIEDAAEKTSTPTGQFCNVHERVLVCISTYPNSAQLLRRGARLASGMRARLYALFVIHPERFLTKDESLYIETCEHFCQEFGGDFLRIKSANVAQAIAQTAKKYHITQVVIGQSQKSRWDLLLRGSLVQQLVRYLKDVDLHVIATEKLPINGRRKAP